MSNSKKMILGVAWYQPEQWSLLRALAADADELEQTHAEWLAGAVKTLEDLRKQGVPAVRVDVDLHELCAWCQSHGRALDGKARAEYVAEKLRNSNSRQGDSQGGGDTPSAN